MPNHVTTKLEVSGPNEQLQAFLACVRTSKSQFDFNGIIPRPADLDGTRSPTKIMTQAEIQESWKRFNSLPPDKRHGDDKPFDLGITQEESRKLIAAYGFDNWYDWSLHHWGTKWNAYSVSEWQNTQEGSAVIKFETAWSTAIVILLAASLKFPDLVFFHKFHDEGGFFMGTEKIQNGHILEKVELSFGTPEGISMEKELGVWYEPDPENDEDETSLDA